MLQAFANSCKTDAKYLIAAAQSGDMQMVEQLIDFVDINALDKDSGTALQVAALAGKKDVVKLLLDRGANPNLGAGRWENPVTAAANNNTPEIMLLLLTAGADPNTPGILRFAASRGETTSIGYLLDAGADIDAVDENDGTALQSAALAGKVDAVKLLLDRGANPNLGAGRWENPVTAAANNNTPEIMLLLLTAGADPNTPGILRFAASRGEITSIGYLLDAGADIDAVDKNDGTALQSAALAGKEDAVKLLLDRGANPNLGAGRWQNPLMAAVSLGRKNIAQELLSRGARPS
jgi:ankyrin repeat protein